MWIVDITIVYKKEHSTLTCFPAKTYAALLNVNNLLRSLHLIFKNCDKQPKNRKNSIY